MWPRCPDPVPTLSRLICSLSDWTRQGSSLRTERSHPTPKRSRLPLRFRKARVGQRARARGSSALVMEGRPPRRPRSRLVNRSRHVVPASESRARLDETELVPPCGTEWQPSEIKRRVEPSHVCIRGSATFSAHGAPCWREQFITTPQALLLSRVCRRHRSDGYAAPLRVRRVAQPSVRRRPRSDSCPFSLPQILQ